MAGITHARPPGATTAPRCRRLCRKERSRCRHRACTCARRGNCLINNQNNLSGRRTIPALLGNPRRTTSAYVPVDDAGVGQRQREAQSGAWSTHSYVRGQSLLTTLWDCIPSITTPFHRCVTPAGASATLRRCSGRDCRQRPNKVLRMHAG